MLPSVWKLDGALWSCIAAGHRDAVWKCFCGILLGGMKNRALGHFEQGWHLVHGTALQSLGRFACHRIALI